jgi:hypothetical protein
MLDVDDLAAIIDTRDQTKLISSDIKDRESADKITEPNTARISAGF